MGVVFFGQGWWSAGLDLTLAVGFGVAFLIASSRFGSGLTLFVLFAGVGPSLAVSYAYLLFEFANPEPGCTEECWGELGLVVIAIVGLIAWEIGLLCGCVVRYARKRFRTTR